MSLDLLRSAITVGSFAVFLGVVVWAWARRNQARFDDAAHVPFLDDDRAERP